MLNDLKPPFMRNGRRFWNKFLNFGEKNVIFANFLKVSIAPPKLYGLAVQMQ